MAQRRRVGPVVDQVGNRALQDDAELHQVGHPTRLQREDVMAAVRHVLHQPPGDQIVQGTAHVPAAAAVAPFHLDLLQPGARRQQAGLDCPGRSARRPLAPGFVSVGGMVRLVWDCKLVPILVYPLHRGRNKGASVQPTANTSPAERRKQMYQRGPTVVFACRKDPRFSYCMYVPPSYDADPAGHTLIVAMHGTGRTMTAYRDGFAPFARFNKCVVLAPLFPVGVLGDDYADGFQIHAGGRHPLRPHPARDGGRGG